MSLEGQLSLNISTSSTSQRRPPSSQDRWPWNKYKQRSLKRKSACLSSRNVSNVTSNQRSLDLPHRPTQRERKEEEGFTRSGKAPAKDGPQPQQTDGEQKRRRVVKRKMGEERGEKDGEQKREDRPFIKTSSLFNRNPDILDVHRPAVTQLKERVFSSDSFSDMDLHPHLVATLNKVLNVTTLTSVQKQTIPVLLAGRDAVVRSQTGSGKTLAYGIPLVQSLQAVEPKIKRADGPLAVIIVPTRELAQQIFQTLQKLLKPFTWIVPGVLMGGEKKKSEKARLRRGINILVSTPGRLVDHIKNTLSMAFSAVRWLILDEADRILDLGFEKDLTVILNSLNSTGPDRQNVLLSATLNSDILRLAGVCMKDPVSIHISDPTASSDIIKPKTPDSSPASQSESFAVPEALKQHVVVVPSKLRLVCLAAFIMDKCKFSKDNKLIVFISSCEAVEFLLSLFTSVLCGPSANHTPPLSFLRLHGNMKQEERTEVFQEFSISKTGVLLCTDVAARGLDLPQVTWIVQYDPPSSAVDYVHRVGRTARIGTRGNSLLFLTPAETAYITELANHNISLSEIKLLDILSNLRLDDTYRGRGKYYSERSSGALEQEIRERATVLQTEFENTVHSSKETVLAAKKALQSFLRSYTAYPSNVKHIFHIKAVHLGHAAKSFGLRDAPHNLATAAGLDSKDRNQAKNQAKGKGTEHRPVKMLSSKQRQASLLLSEYASGMEGDDAKKKKKKKKSEGLTGEEDEGME